MEYIVNQLQLHNKALQNAEPKTKNESLIYEKNADHDDNFGLENKKKLLDVICKDLIQLQNFLKKRLNAGKEIPEYVFEKIKEHHKGDEFIIYKNIFHNLMEIKKKSINDYNNLNLKQLEQLVTEDTEAWVIAESIILNYGSKNIPKFLIDLILQSSYTTINHSTSKPPRGKPDKVS
jgi:hypothetical protein